MDCSNSCRFNKGTAEVKQPRYRPGGAQRVPCWIPKATNTHSGCVILIAFSLQQWLHEHVSRLLDTYTFCLVKYAVCKKGKAVPLLAWSVPEGSRKLRFPDYMTTAQDGGKVVSLKHRPPLPQEILQVHISVTS